MWGVGVENKGCQTYLLPVEDGCQVFWIQNTEKDVMLQAGEVAESASCWLWNSGEGTSWRPGADGCLVAHQREGVTVKRENKASHFPSVTLILVITLQVQVIGSVVYSNYTVRVQVVPSPLVASIQGGTNIFINNRNTTMVSLDGQQSYDPDFPMNPVR